MAFALTFKRGYALGGRRQYTLPLWLWLGLSRGFLDGRQRPVAIDAEKVIGKWRVPPRVEGRRHIPATGPTVVVANHYQRRGLWIGFAGGVLARELRHTRQDQASVHIAVIGDMRLRGRVLPGTGLLLRRIAAVWDMVPLPTGPRDAAGRAAALRRLVRLAAPPPRGKGHPILLFPEGTEGSTAGLREALPGTGMFLAMLSRRGVPILPAAVWECGGHITACFGPAFALEVPEGLAGDDRDRWARVLVMRRIAALLPRRLHGAYAGPFGDELDCGEEKN